MVEEVSPTGDEWRGQIAALVPTNPAQNGCSKGLDHSGGRVWCQRRCAWAEAAELGGRKAQGRGIRREERQMEVVRAPGRQRGRIGRRGRSVAMPQIGPHHPDPGGGEGGWAGAGGDPGSGGGEEGGDEEGPIGDVEPRDRGGGGGGDEDAALIGVGGGEGGGRDPLLGAHWEVRVGALCFATFGLRHVAMAGLGYWIVGGPILVLPYVFRCLIAQLLGLALYRPYARIDERRDCRFLRGALLLAAVTADFAASLAMTLLLVSWIDFFFREPSPSRPVNTYWVRTHGALIALLVADPVLALVPLYNIWRASVFWSFRASSAPPQGLAWPAAVLCPRRAHPPGRATLWLTACARLLALLSVLFCVVWLGFASAVYMRLLGAGLPGSRCERYLADGAGFSVCVPFEGVCDPIDPSECMLPFPSDFFLEPDGSSETGARVHISPRAMLPLNGGGALYLNPEAWNDMDGFSTMAPILFRVGDGLGSRVALPGGMDGAGPRAYLNRSTDAGQTATVLVDGETGELVPHWVEPDVAMAEGGDRFGTLLVLQPAVPLRNSRRYVVGVRGLELSSGWPLPERRAAAGSEGFQRLRDGRPEGEEEGERAARYGRRVFPAIEAHGWRRPELQLAWEFSTVSWKSGPARAQRMVRDCVARLSSGEAESRHTVDDVVEEMCEWPLRYGRQVWGTLLAPSYTVSPGPGAELPRGAPAAHRSVDVRFVALLPCSALESPSPAPYAIQFGHGLFATRSEAIESDWLRAFAERHGAPVIAVDWAGMSRFDFSVAAKILLSDLGKFRVMPDQLQQGFVNGASLIWYVRNRLPGDLAFLGAFGQRLLQSDTPVHFYGISMGGVPGSAYVLSSPFIRRATLSMAGNPWALIYTRSAIFYKGYLQVPRPTHMRIAFTLLQQLWDVAEGAGWFSGLYYKEEGSGLDEGQRFLLQDALGDSQIPTLAAQLTARSLGCSTVRRETREVFGVPEAQQPILEGSALVEFAYLGTIPETLDNTPCDTSTDHHLVVRRDPAGQAQIAGFFAEGEIRQTCGFGECTNRPLGFVARGPRA